MMAILEVIDLEKSYGTTRALNRVTFEVAQGEMFGLLGPNGAGKTTLLSILSCLSAATAGQARILGHPVSPHDRALRRLIGIVPQELALYGELTARENLEFFARLYDVRGAELARRVSQVLESVALADRADDRVETFSGGMKRRLNLGVALMHQPKLLMLDEPTTGVDPQSRNHIFESVRRLNSEGMTVVYTSHYMEEVQALCKRIGIIDQGKVVACDTLEGLLHKLTGLIRLQVRPITPPLCDQLRTIAGVTLTQIDECSLHLQCADVKAALVRVVAVLNEQNVELVGLETEEPNLERIFLHLTGRALRD